MPKVMFLAAVTKPRPEHNFDGKLGVWEFAIERVAKRSNKATGTVAGETIIMEDVKVDAEAYRKKITGKGGVFEAVRKTMWWFKKNAKHHGQPTPEAGKTLYMQQDGARPHTTAVNLNHFASEGKKYGFDIVVVIRKHRKKRRPRTKTQKTRQATKTQKKTRQATKRAWRRASQQPD